MNRTVAGRSCHLAISIVFLALAACTPSLNWREVHLAGVSTLMPCKPDQAKRQVTLEGLTVTMEMLGCEADGALYAVSSIPTENSDQAQGVMARLRSASLQSVKAVSIQPIANSGNERTSFDLQADGTSPQGSAVQARFKWLMQGNVVYQIAVYAPKLEVRHMDSFISGIRLQ